MIASEIQKIFVECTSHIGVIFWHVSICVYVYMTIYIFLNIYDSKSRSDLPLPCSITKIYVSPVSSLNMTDPADFCQTNLIGLVYLT